MALKDKIREMLEADPFNGVIKDCEHFSKRAQEIGQQLEISLAAANKALASLDLEVACLEFAKCALLIGEWAEMQRTLQTILPIVENLEKLRTAN